MNISNDLYKVLLIFQKNEITEHHIYRKLALSVKAPENRRILADIADDEMRHYCQWREYTRSDVAPDRLRIWMYFLISKIFGLTFGVKLMERGEGLAQTSYGALEDIIPEAEDIARSENEHEAALLGLLDEEKLRYIGSIVLGLSDALVELTGALAGFTLALQNAKLIALTGLITGIAAALSMGASEYLSTKTEETAKNPLRASFYTIGAYFITVMILTMPFLILKNYYVSLICTLSSALLIIALFSYYISVAKDVPFKRRFLEMAGLSLGVAAFSFIIGLAIRTFLGVAT